MTTTELPTRLTKRDVRLIKRGLDIINSGELRRVRDALHLSRPRMAALLDTTEFNVRHWELHKGTPHDPRTLIRIAEVVDKLSQAIDDTS